MNKKLKFSIGTIGLVVVVVITSISMPVAGMECDELTLRNVEALSSSDEDSEFKCVMYKDKCTFKIKTETELGILKKLPGFGSLKIGAEIDLTNATQLYREKKKNEVGVRCGEDKTCNDALKAIGISK